MMRPDLDPGFMSRALQLANKALEHDEIPVGAVVVFDNKIIGEGFNCSVANHDPSGHAEIMALRDAAKNTENYRLNEAALYVTLEPCIMCAGAILQARIERVIFATHDPKSGAAGSQLNLLQSKFLNHRCAITSGVLQQPCRALIQMFFKGKRQ